MERLGWGSIVVAGAVSIALTDKRNLSVATARGEASFPVGEGMTKTTVRADLPNFFLRIPPFPGAKVRQFAEGYSAPRDLKAVADDLRRHRVGGAFWAKQPKLPADCLVVRAASAVEAAIGIAANRTMVYWPAGGNEPVAGAVQLTGDCDPWHVLSVAKGVVVEIGDEIRLVAALLGVPAYLVEAGNLVRDDASIADLLERHLPAAEVENPFTGEPMTISATIELCGFWRRLIDANRDITGGLGFAFWKQDHIGPLLWNGDGDFRFLKSVKDVPPGASVAIWRSKATSQAHELERSGVRLIEVEDGFLRSSGLGADCVPPLSVTVDAVGAYFDPSRPSELERLLQDGQFDDGLLERARELREMIVEAAIGKYEQGGAPLDRPAGERLHILVPGQVEDDRAVETGGCGLTSNLELLKRVRAECPDAYILYKPHPDVLAGHRRGEIGEAAVLELADEIVGELSINSLIAMVDEVHVNTSLAGFEALLRGKKVTTYGVPFYAGWGLTTDLGPVTPRRSTRRSLDELVAATLLVYPRYLDPITGLPCPAEVVVARLAAGNASDPGLLVGVRRLQGKVMRRLRSLVQ